MASLPTEKILSLNFFLFLILFLRSFCINGGARADAVAFAGDEVEFLSAKSKQREFDYFALSLQWPGTYCRKTKQCCSKNACCRGEDSPTEFTIHGLWPDYNDGTWPACCDGPAFEENEISTLQDALDKYWPSLSCSSSTTCHGKKGLFWAHEWEKHGTCSYPVVRDEYNYFLTTLNLYFKYNVTEVLYEAGYVPSNSEKYPVGGIISAIQNAFHTTPLLVCTKGALEELRLCFYKDFTFRDCVNSANSRSGMISASSSCPNYVSLPAYVSLGLNQPETIDTLLPHLEAF